MKKKISFPSVLETRQKLAVIVATVGVGFSPIAPGTLGTLVAVPAVWMLADTQEWVRWIIWLGVLILGIWSARVFDEVAGTQDSSHIVIDEVLGYAVASWTCGAAVLPLLVAFVAFRFFDIFKPFPVRNLDRWSKKQTRPFLRGLGVILDDLAAGVLSLGAVSLLKFLNWVS